MNLNRMAASATLHCLAGCTVGEIVGMVIGMLLGLPVFAVVVLSFVLAFISGFGFSTYPLTKHGLSFGAALSIVFAADTLSIFTMEVVDNGTMLVVPGALNAGLTDPLFWGSMALSLGLAFLVAYPVNRYLLTKGRGHALVMKYHDHSSHH